ncbi:MAG: EAL domain-containing protein [Ilumatobacter sp.]|uniref:putative bifunctional diguanylate cyclase/phosphodiesterase n=1 Tax=Ilumatobacter sp. TaxID=1967498 RepID=UPI003C749FD8
MPSSRYLLLIVAALLTAVYVGAPWSVSVELLRVAAPAIGIGAVLCGMVVHRPARAAPWVAIVVALGLLVAAHAVWATLADSDDVTFPTLADALHVGFWVMMLLATVELSRQSRSEHDAFGGYEIGIIAIAVGVAVWLVVAEPYFSDRDIGFGATAWAAGAPLIGGLAFAAAVRGAAASAYRSFAPVALMCGVGVQLVADMTRGTQEIRGEFESGGLIAGLGVAAPLVIAAAALDRTMAVRNRASVPNAALGVGRTVGLTVAVLSPMTVLMALLVSGLGSGTTILVVSIAAFLAVILALARMWGLLDAVRLLTERRGQDRLAAMVEHSSDVVMLVDESGDIKYASPGLTATLGHRAADWIGRPIVDLIAEEDRAAAAAEVERLFVDPIDATVRFESSLVRVDGERRWMEATFVNLLGGDAVDGIVATFRDVTEQRDLERKLSHRAFHDELTGLANRALFLNRMDHALSVDRPEADPVVVLFVDLDDFKSVNDALGHGVGDQLLRAIADRIKTASGRSDTPARLGGDEFALLLEDRGGIDRAIELAERLLDALRSPVRLAGHDLAVLASVGVAVAVPGMTTSSLLRDADIAMYEAKRAGKGQIKIFDPAMLLGVTTHLEDRSALSTALENREMRLVYQPLVDLRTGEVLGAEALLRWTHPTRGDVSPSEFVPVAERSGLIKEIGEWVLNEAMNEAAAWQACGPRHVSINVSAVQLRTDDFVEHVAAALASSGLAPQQLLLEVTETVLVDEIESASDALNVLRQLGVRVAIDDFGTGYCSLTYLQKFPVDIVKIDRQFVDEVDGDEQRSSLARMILQMTSSMGVTSVAEGIERPGQITALRQFGCDIGQGFLLSHPLEVDMIRQRFGVDLVAAG